MISPGDTGDSRCRGESRCEPATHEVKIWLGNRGSGLPEVVATLGVVEILMGMAVLGLNRRYADLESAHQELTNVVREIRLRSTIRGHHYRLVPSTESYEVRRLQDDDGDGLWMNDPAAAAQTIDLPPGVTLAVNTISGGSTMLEFDTRGVAVDPLGGDAEVVQLTLTDKESRTRTVEVWPSGQVHGQPIVVASP